MGGNDIKLISSGVQDCFCTQLLWNLRIPRVGRGWSLKQSFRGNWQNWYTRSMPSEFGVMALVLGVSVFFGIAAKILKLPAILGFIVAGMVLGGVGRMEFLGKLGVTLL